jgi:hypothetical protein
MIILLGTLLLLQNFDLIDANVWGLMWPIFLIALGLWFLLGSALGAPESVDEEVTLPLEGAAQAHVRVKHGAGRIQMDGSAGPGQLLSGRFGNGLEHRISRQGEDLQVTLKPRHVPFPDMMFPWTWGSSGGYNWNFGITPEIPLSLRFETGAGNAELDLSDLQVTDLKLETGASATTVTLPARAGHTHVDVEAGVASVQIKVPAEVAARIQTQSGLASINVDRERFPKQAGAYRSPDYDSAEHKVDIHVEAGVGSIEIR